MARKWGGPVERRTTPPPAPLLDAAAIMGSMRASFDRAMADGRTLLEAADQAAHELAAEMRTTS
jgi:hypothetical protein